MGNGAEFFGEGFHGCVGGGGPVGGAQCTVGREHAVFEPVVLVVLSFGPWPSAQDFHGCVVRLAVAQLGGQPVPRFGEPAERDVLLGTEVRSGSTERKYGEKKFCGVRSRPLPRCRRLRWRGGPVRFARRPHPCPASTWPPPRPPEATHSAPCELSAPMPPDLGPLVFPDLGTRVAIDMMARG